MPTLDLPDEILAQMQRHEHRQKMIAEASKAANVSVSSVAAVDSFMDLLDGFDVPAQEEDTAEELPAFLTQAPPEEEPPLPAEEQPLPVEEQPASKSTRYSLVRGVYMTDKRAFVPPKKEKKPSLFSKLFAKKPKKQKAPAIDLRSQFFEDDIEDEPIPEPVEETVVPKQPQMFDDIDTFATVDNSIPEEVEETIVEPKRSGIQYQQVASKYLSQSTRMTPAKKGGKRK